MIVSKPSNKLLFYCDLFFNAKLSNFCLFTIMKMNSIQTFIFLDCETTGLPSFEHNQTKITELCLIGVESDHISLGVYPRVLNKLTMCFNPRKLVSPESTRITGLSNDNLEYQTTFSSDTVKLLDLFLNKFKKPICFVAHNGNRFDYPILQAEIHKTNTALQEGILCIDSLTAFRALNQEDQQRAAMMAVPVEETMEQEQPEVPFELCDGYDEILFDAVDGLENVHCGTSVQVKSETSIQRQNETTPPHHTSCIDFIPKAPAKIKPGTCARTSWKPGTSRAIRFPQLSFKLGDIYKRLTSKEPENTHEAEGDVKMLIHCAAIIGERFVQWANSNYRNFEDIPKMTPGKRIGT